MRFGCWFASGAMIERKLLSIAALLLYAAAVAALAFALMRTPDHRLVVGAGIGLILLLSLGMIISLRRSTTDRYTRLLLWMVLLPIVGLAAKVLLAAKEM